MQTFAIHIEGETASPNMRERVDNFLQTVRAEEKTVVRTATFSEHATAQGTDQTLTTHELQQPLDEKALFDAGHRQPAPPPEEETPAEPTAPSAS